MKTFLKMLLASILGGIILIFIFFIVIVSIVSLAEKETIINNGSILTLDVNTVIHDRADNNPFNSFDPFSGESEKAIGLDEVLASIKGAADDEKILGIYLDGGIPITGHASLKEIRDALLEFKKSGKFVYCYSEVMTQKGYYLASVADTLWINPEGVVEWKGLNASVTYFKDALDKLGVKPEIFRATGNKFKSAVEPFMMQQMSEENRQQLETLLNSIWQNYLLDIAESREINANNLDSLANELVFANPSEIAENGLITGTAYEDQMLAVLMEKTGIEEVKDIPLVSVHRYSRTVNLSGDDDYTADKIAVIIAQGEIVNGEGSSYSAGGQRIAEAIRKARMDKKVKAVVLRVNSPGGSALASEVMWREVALTTEVKPVVASMGDLAASGGYYISCHADTIVAQPNTITGSIGAFGMFFTAEELMHDKLGINIETVNTNQFSDIGTIDRPLTDAERRLLISSVDRIYETFKQRVAEGRGLSVEFIDSIGQGRVWSGEDALRLGLVDVMGGLNTAISIASDMADMDEGYRVVVYPELQDPLQKFIEEFSGTQESQMIRKHLGEFAPYWNILEKARSRQGLQTRMEFDIIID